MSEPLGAVLAGGRSRRMGAPKACAELGGVPLIEYPLRAMRAAGVEVVVIAKRDTALPPIEIDVWREPDEPSHPLTGIVAALERADRALVVSGCDLPFVPPELFAELAGACEPLVVSEGAGRLHPLLGRYDVTLLDSLRAARDAERPLHEVVAELDGARLELPQDVLFNVNTPADLARAEEILRRS